MPEFVLKIKDGFWLVPPVADNKCVMCAGAHDRETGAGANEICGSFGCCDKHGKHQCIAIRPHEANEYMVKAVTSKLIGGSS